MSIFFDKADFAGHVYSHVMNHAALAGQEIDGMKLVQIMSGILVETLLLFDDPDDALEATYSALAFHLKCEPAAGQISACALPPAYIMDYETELGRGIAKRLFEDWLSCAYEFHDVIVFMIHHALLRLEQDEQSRDEVFRLFIECANRCMAYEIAAQELCEIVIDKKIARQGWSLSESVSGLSALSGRNLALSHNACELFNAPSLPDKLDQIAFVMTQEATRLGIPAGSDWRFGLAANDCLFDAPHDLIYGLEPCCSAFFAAVKIHDLLDRSVCCAKAAGRMLAIAAGGDVPEIEPVIAKPLAMAAMTDTYKSVCQLDAAVL